MQITCLLEVLGSSTGIPKGLEKIGNSRREEGLTVLEFRVHGGVEPLVVGCGFFFWNDPFLVHMMDIQ